MWDTIGVAVDAKNLSSTTDKCFECGPVYFLIYQFQRTDDLDWQPLDRSSNDGDFQRSDS